VRFPAALALVVACQTRLAAAETAPPSTDYCAMLGFDDQGTLMLAVSLEDRHGSLTLYDAEGRPRLGCATTEKGAGVSVLGPDSKEVWRAP